MSALEDLHTMTVPEYVRAVEIFGWERTELIEGIVYDMPAEKNRHLMTVMRVQGLLGAAFPGHLVAASGSIELGPESLVNPDVFVFDPACAGDLDGYLGGSAVLIAVEVSVTTLAKDRGPKLRCYARAGIPEVWIIDARAEAGTLLRHTDPVGDRYQSVQQFDVGECAERLAADDVRRS